MPSHHHSLRLAGALTLGLLAGCADTHWELSLIHI